MRGIVWYITIDEIIFILSFIYSLFSEYKENRHAFFKKKDINNIFFYILLKIYLKYEKLTVITNIIRI